MLKDRTEKTKGLWEGLGAKKDIDNNLNANVNIDDNIDRESSDTISDYGKLLKGKQSEEMIMKGLYLRKDQVETLERYSKMANKSYSEFVRDALDIVFSEIEKAQR